MFGLGIHHLYTLQEILRLVDVVKHTNQSTITGGDAVPVWE